MPSTVSPADSSARYAAAFACEPECGCTFANAAPNSCLRALDREHFDLIDVFAAAVVALRRITFGVFVRQHRALRLAARAGSRSFPTRSARCDLPGAASSSTDRLPQHIVVAGKLHFGVEHRGYPVRLTRRRIVAHAPKPEHLKARHRQRERGSECSAGVRVLPAGLSGHRTPGLRPLRARRTPCSHSHYNGRPQFPKQIQWRSTSTP